jgi:hypothetical protein
VPCWGSDVGAARHPGGADLGGHSGEETGFTVQRADHISFTGGLRTFTVGANIIPYTDRFSGANRPHSYRVFATNTLGDKDTPGTPTMIVTSAFSKTAADRPNPPLARQAAPCSVTLTWTYNASNEAGFRIQRGTNATFTSGLNTITVGVKVTTLTQTVPRNSVLYFRIQAYNNADPSACVNDMPFPIHSP